MKLLFRKDKELYLSLYSIIGIYPHDISYYRVALMHKSALRRNENGRLVNNERLEFLGDAILDAIVGDIVYRHFPGKREGFLTNTRSKIVQRDTLNRLASEMGIIKLVTTNGKVHHKTIDVRVKKLPTVKAETVDGNGKRLGFFRQGWQRLLTKWHDATAKLRFAMSTLPEGKQVRVRMMALLGVLLIIGAIWPKLYGLTLVVLVVALAIGLIRK